MAEDATFHFAWVASSETTFSAGSHAIEDEQIFGLRIRHTEGEFATAEIRIQRPSDGLLNISRSQYAWISVTRSATTTALFFGRLIALPSDLTSDVVTLEFVSQFPGWEAARTTLFDSLKVLPYWDPAFIPSEEIDNPDYALEARGARYCYNRTTGTVTASNILSGGSSLAVSNHFDNSLEWGVTGNPARSVTITAAVEWEQRLIGKTKKVNTKIRKAFPGGAVNTFSGPILQEAWPRSGESVGGQSGYQVVKSKIEPIKPLPSTFSSKSDPFKKKIGVTEQKFAGALFSTFQETRDANARRWWFNTSLDVAFDYVQPRKETLTATIDCDVQALAFDADGGDISIDLNAEDVVGLGLMPPRYSTYFLSTRGKRSTSYLLARAEAALAASARAVEISFDMPFFDAIGLSCDHSITLTDSRLPGGTATGKVTSYEFAVDNAGLALASVTIGVSVGNGASYSASGTAGDYCDVDYTGAGYQVVIGETYDADIPKIIYEEYGNQLPSDPAVINKLRNSDLIESLTITNDPVAQAALLLANQHPVLDDAEVVINQNPTQIALQLRDLTPETNLEHTITLVIPHPWEAPQGIDLAA